MNVIDGQAGLVIYSSLIFYSLTIDNILNIVVLLILAGITVTMLFGENGIINKAQQAKEKTERDQLETQQGLQDLNDQMSTILNGEGSDGIDNGKIAVFDTGTNVATKIRSLVADGNKLFMEDFILNLSIDEIKQYTGTPDISSMTDDNIVSWTEGYELYKQSPELFEDFVPAGMEVCPIYMWFEDSGETKKRTIYGEIESISTNSPSKEVPTGTLYWWCETSNVYLNYDSSWMFGLLPYLSDITGLQNIKTDYITDISYMFGNIINQSLTEVNALSNWNTSAVSDMSYMFGSCGSLTDISALENWNTSAVTDMSYMFGNSYEGMDMNLSDISYLSKWDVSNVTNMRQMFYNCDKLLDASGINDWNIINVTNFEEMFGGCSTHPEFTKVTGTWDENGTFNPD